MFYICIDDLVGNAFVAYLQETNSRILETKKIKEFGERVIKSLKKDGFGARFNINKDSFDDFFCENSDMFRLITNNKGPAIALIDDQITQEDLIKKFSGVLSLEVLLAYRDKKNIKVLTKK